MTQAAGDFLRCERLEVGLPGRAVLATVDMRFAPVRVTAILGPNGAGKSTLLSMLSGQRVARSGQVLLGDRTLPQFGAMELARRRAVLPQDTVVAFDFTVREVVELGRFPHRQHPSRHESSIVDSALQATGVAHLADRSVNTLSGGERARTHLARALAQIWEAPQDGATRWLLLDEPTAALDLAHQHQAMGWVRRWATEQGVGVVAVLHDLNLALRYAHDVVLMGDGSCSGGPVLEVLQPEAIRRIWGVNCSSVVASDGVPQFLVAVP